MASKKTGIAVYDGDRLVARLTARAVRLMPDGYAGVVYNGAVYHLYKGIHIHISNEPIDKNDCANPDDGHHSPRRPFPAWTVPAGPIPSRDLPHHPAIPRSTAHRPAARARMAPIPAPPRRTAPANKFRPPRRRLRAVSRIYFSGSGNFSDPPVGRRHADGAARVLGRAESVASRIFRVLHFRVLRRARADLGPIAF